MTPTRWLLTAALAVLLLYVSALIFPAIFYDDFQILSHAFTWEDTRAGLWVPQNEHTMPLGRLTTWALVQLSPDVHALVRMCVLHGILAVLLALPLVYCLVAREVDSPALGLVAAFCLGVHSIYYQATVWFAASFSILALDTLLLALLAAQSWRRTGRYRDLGLCLLACAQAPGWFASGILAGPLCFLYLIVPSRNPARSWLGAFVPLLGSALFLAVALPLVARTILHLPHYQGRSALEAFNPLVGLLYTGRSIIDNLLLGQVGITGVSVPVVLVLPMLLALAVALVIWLRPVRDLRLALLGLGLILLPYLLTYGARATWSYDESRFYSVTWTRYHLFPQLGVVMLVVAGLAARCPGGDWSALAPRWNRPLGWLLLGLLLVQAPRAVLSTPGMPEQGPAFARIAQVDARCRAAGISRQAALEALPPWTDFPASSEGFNAWTFLRGSTQPREVPPEEIRRLLLNDQ